MSYESISRRDNGGHRPGSFYKGDDVRCIVQGQAESPEFFNKSLVRSFSYYEKHCHRLGTYQAKSALLIFLLVAGCWRGRSTVWAAQWAS